MSNNSLYERSNTWSQRFLFLRWSNSPGDLLRRVIAMQPHNAAYCCRPSTVVGLCVRHVREPCKNGLTDPDAVHVGRRNHLLDVGRSFVRSFVLCGQGSSLL